jgi:hypothetical protein
LEASFSRFLKPGGILSFITPKFYLLNKEDKPIRDYFLNQVDIVLLALCNPFDAVTENVITIIRKSAPTCEVIHAYKHSLETKTFEVLPVVRKIDCQNNGYHEIVLGNDASIQNLLGKYDKNAVLLKSICSSKRGAEIGKKAVKSLTSGAKTLIGEDISKYTTNWGHTHIAVSDKEYKRLSSFFGKDLILLRRVDSFLSATIAEGEAYAFTKNVYGLRVNESRGFSRLYVLGWLNSKPTSFYYRKKFSTKKEKAFPEIQVYLYEQLPIPNADVVAQRSVEELVRKALDVRKSDTKADISSIEKSIDTLFYRLYGFNYDEVLMIDPDFSLTRNEYETLND